MFRRSVRRAKVVQESVEAEGCASAFSSPNSSAMSGTRKQQRRGDSSAAAREPNTHAVARRPTKKRRRTGDAASASSGAGNVPSTLDVMNAVRALVRQRDGTASTRGLGPGAGAGSGSVTAATLAELGIEDVIEVAERDSNEVLDALEGIIVKAADQIMAGLGFTFSVPNRSSSNQLYVADLDRIVLKDKLSARPFVSTATVRKTTVTTRVIQLIHQVLLKRIHVTKRDLFYTDVKLFNDQRESDTVLDDIACMAGCTRTSLNVVASEKGIVVGRVQFRDDGDLIDCSRMGVGGKAIPPFIDRISDIESDAEFILLVEKDAAFMRLAEDRFYNKYPCIIITAKGQPDVATRLFLKRMKTTLKLPVFGLVDSDPYGAVFVCVCVCVCVWLCGYVAMWLCGYVAMWQCWCTVHGGPAASLHPCVHGTAVEGTTIRPRAQAHHQRRCQPWVRGTVDS